MAGKFDKEALKKNQFWIGLGGFGLLWVVGLVVVLVTGKAKAAREAYKQADTKIAAHTPSNTKSELPGSQNKFNHPWEVHGAKFKAHKDRIWQKAWASQAAMYIWPQDMDTWGSRRARIRPQKDGKFSTMPALPESLTDDEKAARSREINERNAEDTELRERFPQLYRKQFAGLEEFVFPVEFNGGFFSVFPVQVWDRQSPLREEIHLAQEDFLVRREMLEIVRSTLDNVAAFREVTEEVLGKQGKGMVTRRIFRNSNWELDLVFEKDAKSKWCISGKSKIKNINPTNKIQPLVNPRTDAGLPFRIVQDPREGLKPSPVEWRITGEPVPPGIAREVPELTSQKLGGIDLSKRIQLAQLLYWELSPVRRIDALEVARHSHRTAISGLKPNEEMTKRVDPETAKAAEEAGTESGGAAAGMGGMQMGGSAPPLPGGGRAEGPGGPGGGAATGDVTAINKIPRPRYMHLTPTCRHLPIGMRLIVDQAHIHDVLASVCSNRMRVQITQVTITHVSDVKRVAIDTKGTGGKVGGVPGGEMFGMLRGGTPPPGGAGMLMPGGERGSGSFSPPGGYRPEGEGPGQPGMVGGGGPQENATQFRDTAKLVELTIYGIASLFEPFDPNVKMEKTP